MRDTGCGISQADCELIFKEFFRAEQTRALHDGLGLGLAIVKRLTQLIDATLSVKSRLGSGTTFLLQTKYTLSQELEHQAMMPAYATTSVEPVSSAASTGSKHIAIIEDDEALLDAYQKLFSAAGFVVHTIPIVHAELSNSLLTVDRLDFVLSDFRLGAKNGVDFIQSIREEYNAEIPALLLTADTSPQHIQMFSDLNIRVLYKPIKSKEILDYVNEYLATT